MIKLIQSGIFIEDPEKSISFYTNVLKMHLVYSYQQGANTHFFLSFLPKKENADYSYLYAEDRYFLELIYNPNLKIVTKSNSKHTLGYWKIGITLNQIKNFYNSLTSEHPELNISKPHSFEEIDAMSHLYDNNNYCIELLERTEKHLNLETDKNSLKAYHSTPLVAHVTLRVNDPKQSLDFYSQILNTNLIAKIVVIKHRFTLYFLSHTGDKFDDEKNVHKNLGWLWNRPDTLIELQHYWDSDIKYHPGNSRPYGFSHLGFKADSLDEIVQNLKNGHIKYEISPYIKSCDRAFEKVAFNDPEGYGLEVVV